MAARTLTNTTTAGDCQTNAIRKQVIYATGRVYSNGPNNDWKTCLPWNTVTGLAMDTNLLPVIEYIFHRPMTWNRNRKSFDFFAKLNFQIQIRNRTVSTTSYSK